MTGYYATTAKDPQTYHTNPDCRYLMYSTGVHAFEEPPATASKCKVCEKL